MKYPQGHEFEIKALRPSQLSIDPLYQRKLDMRRVEKIVREFNGDLFNEPKVSLRDGKYWVFNGQHSTAAWRKYYNDEDKPMPCKVYKGMTWYDECMAFIAQNGISVDPTTTDKLRAAFEAKRQDVVSMVQCANVAGFEVDFTLKKNKNNTIVAIATLFKAFHALGPAMYTDMLMAIKEAWNGDANSTCTQIIYGMTGFYKAYSGSFKRSDLVSSLEKTTPTSIIREGRMLNGKNVFAREIVRCYNIKRRNRLDVSLLM